MKLTGTISSYHYLQDSRCLSRDTDALMYFAPNREIIDKSISKEAQPPELALCTSSGRRNYSLANPPPNPTLPEQNDHTSIHFWFKSLYKTESIKRKKKGETDGQATSVRIKKKAGRPRKSSTEEPEDHSAHFYLEYDDGTPVSSEDISDLSQLARATWEDLHDVKLAPTTFCKMSRIAWDYFWRSMVSVPQFSFLLLCEGGQWKLRQWSIKSYPSWAANRGIRQVKPKTEVLDDAKLIQMDTDTETNNNQDRKSVV